MQPIRRLPHTAGIVLATLVAAALIAACGGSNNPSAATGPNAATAHADAIKFAQCMRNHGVSDFPDPSQTGGVQIQQGVKGGVRSLKVDGRPIKESWATFGRASRTCRHFQPPPPRISAAQLAKVRQGAVRMARCMRAHGVPNFPDPQVGAGPGGRGLSVGIRANASAGGPGIDPQSPAFRAASKICQPLMTRLIPGAKSGS